MKCKITRNAAKVLLQELNKEENKGRSVRVAVTHRHGDHAHYGLQFAVPREGDVQVMTDKGIEVLLDGNEPLLDGVKIDYLYLPYERFVISNPSQGNYGDH